MDGWVVGCIYMCALCAYVLSVPVWIGREFVEVRQTNSYRIVNITERILQLFVFFSRDFLVPRPPFILEVKMQHERVICSRNRGKVKGDYVASFADMVRTGTVVKSSI